MPQVIKQHPTKPDHFQIERSVLQYEDVPKEKPELSELYQSTHHAIAVLGGGPSLPEDMYKLPDNRLSISCNHHAFRIAHPDYMVFLDDPDHISTKNSTVFQELVRDCPAKRISPVLKYTDYYTVNEFPKVLNPLGDTGMFGAWVACYITSGPVYLCGMGVNRNGQEHFYKDKPPSDWGGYHYDNKIKKWEQVFKHCEKPERIKAISGPLKDLLCGIK